jgi:hypothetical protein
VERERRGRGGWIDRFVGRDGEVERRTRLESREVGIHSKVLEDFSDIARNSLVLFFQFLGEGGAGEETRGGSGSHGHHIRRQKLFDH